MRSSYKLLIGILLLTFFFGRAALAQEKDSTRIGSILGSVKDTASNYFLQSATVAVNRAGDGSLVAYSLTNGLGEFHLKGLPIGVRLKVTVSFVGYGTNSSVFILSKEKPVLDIGEIQMVKSTGRMEDSVVVTPPPVRMNGDTLEFNASAFSLDKNAVAEDLLKKLPGVIIWGDGTITVNGRQISKLLVDGKPFLGKDVQVATQNIPKSSIDKIQVYQEQVNIFDPLDSTSTINIKLRKNSHSGNFGTFSAGEGTDSRYEVGANDVLFTPRTQLAVAGQTNNTNRLASDVATLLRNNTYKGSGVRVEYQPDFTMQGRNKPASGGFLFTHDLAPVFNDYEKNRVSANSFIDHNDNLTVKNTQTVTYIGNGASLIQNNADNLKYTTDAADFKSGYIKHRDENTFTIDGAFHLNNRNTVDSSENSIYGPGTGLVSSDLENHRGQYTSHKVGLESVYEHNGFSSTSTRKLTNWKLAYSLRAGEGHLDSTLKTNFTSIGDTALNRFYDRRYSNDLHNLDQKLSMQLGDLSAWLFGSARRLSVYHILLKNDLSVGIARHNNVVSDEDTSAHAYFANDYLTANNRFTEITETPDLRIGRSFSFILANRYQKELSIYLDARGQLYYQQNASTHAFQQFNFTYRKFIPTVDLEYTNFQYGEFFDKYSLILDQSYDYPTADQRVPLVDSSNIYLFRIGNPFLQPAKKYELTAKFRHDGYGTKNTFSYGGQLTGDITEDYPADSSLIDESGRYISHLVNLDGYRSLAANLFVNKAFVSNAHEFQINLSSFSQLSRIPGYLQYAADPIARFNPIGMFIHSDTLSLYYTFADRVALNLVENFSYFRSTQEGLANSTFTNRQSLTRVGAGVNLTKRLMFSSNIAYNSFITSGSGAAAYHYTIWNASMAYRFLPGNNLELKASALDLLNQNKGVISYGGNLGYTHGTVNILRQYFMITMAYYPRKFDRKKRVGQ
jgi:hypothetical protein